MTTLIDSLIQNLQRDINNGKKTTRIDADVLQEFLSDSITPVAPAPAVSSTATVAPVKPAAPIVNSEPAEVQSAPTENVSQVQAPLVEEQSVPIAKPEPPKPQVPAFAQPEAPAVPVGGQVDVSQLTLEELRSYGNTCSACKGNLGERRSETTAVNEQAKLMVITEPAGRSEEHMSDPFHGEAGSLLLKMIRAMNVNPDDIYLCMAHRCFGPGAREKIVETKPYLQRQIDIIKPQVILIFGGAALNILLGEQSLMNCRGRWLEIGDIPVMATFPPAYLIHKAESKKDAWKDMQQIMARLQV